MDFEFKILVSYSFLHCLGGEASQVSLTSNTTTATHQLSERMHHTKTSVHVRKTPLVLKDPFAWKIIAHKTIPQH